MQCDVLHATSQQCPGGAQSPFTLPASTTVLAEQLALQGTILPGVTRKSVIQLLQAAGYQVEETNVTVSEAMEADEVFTTGTAVVVCAVGSLTYKVGLGGSMLPCCSWQTATVYTSDLAAPPHAVMQLIPSPLALHARHAATASPAPSHHLACSLNSRYCTFRQ